MQLRPYQINLLSKINKSFLKNKFVLGTAPTGAGKTVIAFKFIKQQIDRENRVLFVVNREELVFQSLDKFKELFFDISIIKAGHDQLFNASKKIQIAMLQTWHARKIDDLNPDIIIIDEVHEGWGAKRISELLEMYPDAKVLGLTATPITEKGHLLEGFDDVIQEIQVKELIEGGHLVKPRVFIPSELDLSNVRTTGNDYNSEDLDKVLIEINQVQNIVKQYQLYADGLKTIVFANSIAHAEALYLEFQLYEYKAAILHSQIKNLDTVRKDILKKFKNGDIQIIINVGILTTGFDEGSVQCVLLARPTKILRLYIQIAGRGLRTCKEISKKECLFLDCANITKMHGYPDDIRIFVPKSIENNEIKITCKKCPECETILSLQAKECPYCGFIFTSDDTPKLNKQEAEKLIQLKNIQQDCIDNLRRYLDSKNYKKGYSFWLMKDVAKIKPVKFSAFIYYKKVLNMIEKMSKNNYKPQWLIYKLSDHYKAESSLNTVKRSNDVA